MGETYTFGKYGGKLKHLEPETLLMPLFEEMNSIFPKIIPDIDDVVIGNIVGNGGNIARKALLEAGLAESIPGVTMDRQCGSGLESIIYACRMVQAGAGHIYIAGGVESTSRAPWKIKRLNQCMIHNYQNFMSVLFCTKRSRSKYDRELKMLRNIIILRVNNKMPLRYVVIISHINIIRMEV